MKKNAGTPLGVPARAVDTLTVAAPVARGERWKTRGIAPSETTPSAAVLAAPAADIDDETIAEKDKKKTSGKKADKREEEKGARKEANAAMIAERAARKGFNLQGTSLISL